MHEIPAWKKRLMRRRFLISVSVTAAAILAVSVLPLERIFLAIEEQPVIVAIAVQIVAIFVAIQSMNKTRNTSVVAKTVDVSMHCTLRYDKLQDVRAKIDSSRRELEKFSGRDRDSKEEEIEYLETNYESSFWVLKSDQFDFWLVGALDHDTFFDWSYYLAVKYLRELDPPAGPQGDRTKKWSLHDSWERWRGTIGGLSHGGSNPRFVAFINRLMKSVKNYADDSSLQKKQLAKAVLDLMMDMEGSGWNPGFSRMYRALAWSGFKFKKYYQLMHDDLDDENSNTEINAGTEDRQ